MLQRITGIVLALCFVAFAAVQYNDPDPFIWILIYLSAAVFSVAAAFGKVNRTLLLVAAIFYAIGVIYCWPEQFEGVSDSMRDATTGYLIKNVEEGRESLGLAMCSISMVILLLLSKYSNQKSTHAVV